MTYYTRYDTSLVGMLTLASNGEGLTGCWFENSRYFARSVIGPLERCDALECFAHTCDWLDRYFANARPDPHELSLAAHATPFQALVREAMLAIPYGETTTYGAIAQQLEVQTGRRQSARAVGGAVGRNPLAIIVPCHRVIGSNGSLTGFGGGIDTKVRLLKHEGAMRPTFKVPARGTAINGIEGAAHEW